MAPTVFNFKNCGVNWYLTNLPAFGSASSWAISASSSSGSVLIEIIIVKIGHSNYKYYNIKKAKDKKNNIIKEQK